jgi:hypothetical protein
VAWHNGFSAIRMPEKVVAAFNHDGGLVIIASAKSLRSSGPGPAGTR